MKHKQKFPNRREGFSSTRSSTLAGFRKFLWLQIFWLSLGSRKRLEFLCRPAATAGTLLAMHKILNAMFKYLSYFTILLFSSSTVESQNLDSNKSLNKYFTDTEVLDLNNIILFFEQSICASDNTDISLTHQCYISFFKRMEKCIDTGDFDIKISYQNQRELYNQILESTFNQIWSLSQERKFIGNDKVPVITFNYSGNYIKFINTLGKENEIISEYADSYSSAGDITPGMIAMILVNYNRIDITDARMKLVVAIHYLTLNDNYERYRK